MCILCEFDNSKALFLERESSIRVHVPNGSLSRMAKEMEGSVTDNLLVRV